MWKAWKALLGIGARVVVEYTLSVYTGLETIKGWVFDDPAAWAASFADWPLYAALAFFACGMFTLGSIHLAGVVKDWRVRVRRRQERAHQRTRDILVQTMEGAVQLLNGETYHDPMQRLSLLDLARSQLANFDLAAPNHLSQVQQPMHYQRLLPYLRISTELAQQEAKSLSDAV